MINICSNLMSTRFGNVDPGRNVAPWTLVIWGECAEGIWAMDGIVYCFEVLQERCAIMKDCRGCVGNPRGMRCSQFRERERETTCSRRAWRRRAPSPRSNPTRPWSTGIPKIVLVHGLRVGMFAYAVYAVCNCDSMTELTVCKKLGSSNCRTY